MMAILAVVFGISFTACSDNDEPQQEEAWSTSFEVSFKLSDDVFKGADVTAYIAGPDGSMRTEKVASNKNWTLTGNKVPGKAGVLLSFVPKQNIDAAAVYDIKMDYSISATCFVGNDKVNDKKSYSSNEEVSIAGSDAADFFTGSGIALAMGVDANGKVVEVDPKDFDFGFNGIWKDLSEILKDLKGK